MPAIHAGFNRSAANVVPDSAKLIALLCQDDRAIKGDCNARKKVLIRRKRCGGAAARFSAPLQAKDFIKAERPQQRGYSVAVITEGGKTVWLAGQTATVDDSGKSLAGDFEGQARQIFKLLGATLEKAGGKLSDMVTMTVFITDVRYGDRLTQIRREIFGDNFPGSALITISGLANPDAKIEIQGVAVIGSK